MTRKITFSRDGLALVGNLYTPESVDVARKLIADQTPVFTPAPLPRRNRSRARLEQERADFGVQADWRRDQPEVTRC